MTVADELSDGFERFTCITFQLRPTVHLRRLTMAYNTTYNMQYKNSGFKYN